MSDGTATTSVPPDGCAGAGVCMVTQTLPSATASACGLAPIGSGALGLPVRSSMCVSVPSPAFATQMPPAPAAIPVGAAPTWYVFSTELVAGSIDLTVSSNASVTQTACLPTAIDDGR